MQSKTLNDLACEYRESGRMFDLAIKTETDERQLAEYKRARKFALRKYDEIIDQIKELECDYKRKCYVK